MSKRVNGNRLEGSDPDPFGYCGEYYDSESGNIYLRARYYNSETGRFISEDPAKDGMIEQEKNQKQSRGMGI